MLDTDLCSYRKKGINRCSKLFLLLIIFVALLIVISIIIARIRPLVIQIALSDATDVITILVNNIVTEKLSEGALEYDDLVELKTDEEGKVTALVTNMANINILQAEITSEVAKELAGNNVTTVYIPIGSLIGGTFFSGIGPKIKTDVLAITNVVTNFENEFSSAGINQTRHKILINVSVTLSVSPFGDDASDTVDTKVSIAETVIVGNVPETYMSFS